MEFIQRLHESKGYKPLASQVNLPPAVKTPVLASLLKRGFTREILAAWDIVWDKAVGAMRLPCYTAAGSAEGLIWRYPQGVQPKYRYSPGFERSKALYGLWRLSGRIEQMILVEGPLDAIWVQQCQLACVAILGSSLSEEQALLLRHFQVRRIVLCFDNDVAGEQAGKKASYLLRELGFWVYRANLPKRYKDIQEVPYAKVKGVLSNPELCVNGSGVLHPRFRRWASNSLKSQSQVWK